MDKQIIDQMTAEIEQTRLDLHRAEEKLAEIRHKKQQCQNSENLKAQRQKEIDRKARTRRLIERGALFESIFPEMVSASDEEVKRCFLQWKANR